MTWRHLRVAADRSHHVTSAGQPAYDERFDDVLKFHEPGLAPVARDGWAWHIHGDGSPAYDLRFRRTFGFYEGLAATVGDGGWRHIRPDGAAHYIERYAWCGNFQGGRCPVRYADGEYAHITASGAPAYDARWRYAGDYRDGIAVVQAADGRSTHIDLAGQRVHDRWFVDLDVFHKGYARACDPAGWTHIDAVGRPIYARRFAAVEPFYNGQARVERFDGALEVIDESGDTVCELRPARRSEFAQLSADMVGFWRTQTIGAAVRLGVIEQLPAAGDEIARSCQMTIDGTRRLLHALAELQLVRGPVDSHDQWELTSRGQYLRAAHPLTLADAALEYAGPFSERWTGLADALREGSAWRAPDVFGQVAREPARCAAHHRMLQSYARHDYPAVADALELRAGERVVDAGGGLGALAQLIAEAHPETSVTVLERPEVVDLARRQGGASGIQWRAANLFEPWGLQADAVVLARVLHDWDDEAAGRILAQARATLAPGGRVFVVEMLVDERAPAGSLCDLHLLTVTGGRERSAGEVERLLTAAGFECAGVRTVAALPSIVIGVAP